MSDTVRLAPGRVGRACPARACRLHEDRTMTDRAAGGASARRRQLAERWLAQMDGPSCVDPEWFSPLPRRPRCLIGRVPGPRLSPAVPAGARHKPYTAPRASGGRFAPLARCCCWSRVHVGRGRCGVRETPRGGALALDTRCRGVSSLRQPTAPRSS